VGRSARRPRLDEPRLVGQDHRQRAEASLDRLVAGARQQSARLEQLAGRPDLTVGQMADAVEGGAAVGALRELAEQGFVSPPGPS
jgi:hypothetical protein